MPMAELVAMRVYNAPEISWIDPERAERKPNQRFYKNHYDGNESSARTKKEGLEVK